VPRSLSRAERFPNGPGLQGTRGSPWTSRGRLAGCGGAALAAPAAHAGHVPAEARGLGQLSGILPAEKLTLPSAIEVNLSKEYVRLPIYPGVAYAGTSHAEKVWYVLKDASTQGAADDLGVNYAPKLAAAVSIVLSSGVPLRMSPDAPPLCPSTSRTMSAGFHNPDPRPEIALRGHRSTTDEEVSNRSARCGNGLLRE
jgi:hypothetical protein